MTYNTQMYNAQDKFNISSPWFLISSNSIFQKNKELINSYKYVCLIIIKNTIWW